jgi:hypothetical protein
MISKLPVFYDMVWSVENGRLSVDANLYMDETFQTLDELIREFNFQFNEGLNVPIKSNAEIIDIEPNSKLGTVWFNSDDSKLQVKTADGVIETITST